jgi:hypothetical protein
MNLLLLQISCSGVELSFQVSIDKVRVREFRQLSYCLMRELTVSIEFTDASLRITVEGVPLLLAGLLVALALLAVCHHCYQV